tara:strand:+ start:348 stop:542 length:195 start_codon:yes stop_codon:yes gene_type:complete
MLVKNTIIDLKQGKQLTRKQEKAVRQHKAAVEGRPHNLGYKAKVTVAINPCFNVYGELVGWQQE